MSSKPTEAEYSRHQLYEPESSLEKLKKKCMREPLVPIGVLATTAILVMGLRAFKKGDRERSQAMMRYRVFAQGATILAVAAGLFIFPQKKGE